MKSFYLEAFKVITKSLKLDDKEHMKLWRKLTLLCPQNRAFTSEKDMKSKLKSVVYLAQLTPSYIKSDNIQPLIEEWKQLAIEDGIESHEEERLDVYWQRIFEMRKFRFIKSFVTTLLCIQPHNAAEERGFSVNSSVVTKERNRLQLEALNSIRRVRSHLHNIGGLQNFEVTQPLIELARSSFRRYAHCDEDDSD